MKITLDVEDVIQSISKLETSKGNKYNIVIFILKKYFQSYQSRHTLKQITYFVTKNFNIHEFILLPIVTQVSIIIKDNF